MINLELSIDEVNTILTALGKRPYEEVYQLIGKIQEQAKGQLQSTITESSKNKNQSW